MVRRYRGRRGQGLVEFALTLPLLIMFISLGVDFGRYIAMKLALEFAVHDAVRFATLRNPSPVAGSPEAGNGGYPTDDQVRARFVALYPPELPAATVTFSTASVGGVGARRVTASLQAIPYTPGIFNVAGPLVVRAALTLPLRFPNPGGPT
jgi:Flp pilus assembly protein TadG